MPFLRNAFSLHGSVFMMIFPFLFLMATSGIVAGAVMFFGGGTYASTSSVKVWAILFLVAGAIYSITSIVAILGLIYFFFSGNRKVAKFLTWYCMLVIGYNVLFTLLGLGSDSTNAIGYLFKLLTAVSLILVIRFMRNNKTQKLLDSWFSFKAA